MRSITILCALAMTIPLAAQQTTTGDYERETAKVAAAAIPTLRALAEQAPDVVGLTAQEAASAVLASPLREVDVPLDRLKAYTSATDARSLFVDLQTTFYPVLVGSEIRSSITVKRTERGWEATEFGNDELAKRIAAVRGGDSSSALLVRVRALNLDFIAKDTSSGLQLIPLTDIPGTDIRAGSSAPANAVLAALVALANQHNGLPT